MDTLTVGNQKDHVEVKPMRVDIVFPDALPLDFKIGMIGKNVCMLRNQFLPEV